MLHVHVAVELSVLAITSAILEKVFCSFVEKDIFSTNRNALAYRFEYDILSKDGRYPKGHSEAVCQRTDNAMAKRERTNTDLENTT